MLWKSKSNIIRNFEAILNMIDEFARYPAEDIWGRIFVNKSIVMHEAEYVQAGDSHGHQTHHPAQLAHAFLHCKVQTPYILCKWLWIVIAIFHGLHVYPIIMITIH